MGDSCIDVIPREAMDTSLDSFVSDVNPMGDMATSLDSSND